MVLGVNLSISKMERDKYRSHLAGEEEINTQWRHGAPPTYELVNELFEQGRTKVQAFIYYN